MSNHKEIEAQLAMYADLTGAERQAVDQHIQGCEPCAAKLRAYQQMDRSLAGLMASRLQVANRRSIALPRVLVPEEQRDGAPVWWTALQFRLRRGVQRWQPVMVSAVGVIVIAFFFYTYLTYLPKQLPNVPETIQTTSVPDAQLAQAGIEAMLQRELVARHMSGPDQSFVDPDASSAWRTLATRILVQDTHQWQSIPISMEILELGLLQPNMALVRLQIEYAQYSSEVGRFYRLHEGQWYWTQPPAELWGAEQVTETEHLRFEYREWDAAVVAQMADLLERLYVRWHIQLGVPLDDDSDSKVIFQIVSEDTWGQNRSRIQRVGSPELVELPDYAATMNERYTAHLAGSLLNEVIKRISLPPAFGKSGGVNLQSSLLQQLWADSLPFAFSLPSQRDEWLITDTLAQNFPLNINRLLTMPPADEDALIIASTLGSFIKTTYGQEASLTLLRFLVMMPNEPASAIAQSLSVSLIDLDEAWNQWIQTEYPFLQTAIDARRAIERSLSADTTLVELTVKGDLARARVRIEQPETVLSPLVEGRMYRWDGEQWLRTSPTTFPGEATRTIETEHFRMTFQEADTAAVVQAGPVLELAYRNLITLLQLPKAREQELYSFLKGRFEIQVTPETVGNWNAKAEVLKVESPFLQRWPQTVSEGDALAYLIMAHFTMPLLTEVTGSYEPVHPAIVEPTIFRWGVLSSGISQWLLEESLPNPPWRGSTYLQGEIKKYLDGAYPIQLDQLKEISDANASFVVGRLLMEYVKAEYDQKRIAPFLRSMGEYDSWDAITQATFDVDATTFEAEWNQYLTEEYPELTGE